MDRCCRLQCLCHPDGGAAEVGAAPSRAWPPAGLGPRLQPQQRQQGNGRNGNGVRQQAPEREENRGAQPAGQGAASCMPQPGSPPLVGEVDRCARVEAEKSNRCGHAKQGNEATPTGVCVCGGGAENEAMLS